MGLDIIALRRAHRAEPQPDEDYADENYDRFHHCWINTDFPDQSDGLTDGYYEAEEAMHFRAGSYGGYNRWREWLCSKFLHVDPQAVWTRPHEYAGKPFYELINFADNEGIIGPKTAAKLAEDFADHGEDAARQDDDYFYGTYDRFRKAFEMAAEGGLVQFC